MRPIMLAKVLTDAAVPLGRRKTPGEVRPRPVRLTTRPDRQQLDDLRAIALKDLEIGKKRVPATEIPVTSLDPVDLFIMGFGGIADLLASPSLPFRGVGAIHTGLTWAREGEVPVESFVRTTSWISRLAPAVGGRGCEIHILTIAECATGTMLLRSEFLAPRGRIETDYDFPAPAGVGELPELENTVNLRIDRKPSKRLKKMTRPIAGRAFTKEDAKGWARCSGDYNLLHLSSTTARAFGYRAPILHGATAAMWALGILAARDKDVSRGSIRFRAPMLLPAQLELRIAQRGPISGVTAKGRFAAIVEEGTGRDLVHIRLGGIPRAEMTDDDDEDELSPVEEIESLPAVEEAEAVLRGEHEQAPKPNRLILPLSVGKRSTRAIVRSALEVAAHMGGGRPLPETPETTSWSRRDGWRYGYRPVFAAMTEIDMGPEARRAARAGLRYFRRRVQWPDGQALRTLRVSKKVKLGSPQEIPVGSPAEDFVPELALPVGGNDLTGADLNSQLESWLNKGVMRDGAYRALTAVTENPEWLPMRGYTFVVLGAGAELAPTLPLLQWGANVVAVIRPKSQRLHELQTAAADLPGKLTICPPEAGDVITGAQELADYVAGLPGRLVLVDSLYAPGARFLHAALAADAIKVAVCKVRRDTILVMTGTPTDSYLFGDEVRDFALATQGPNYLAAKRINRWRAQVARKRHLVIANVLPMAETESVKQRKSYATAYKGAALVGIVPFAPDTAATLGAMLMVHDIKAPGGHIGPVWTGQAIHSGLWQTKMPLEVAFRAAYALGKIPGVGRS